MEILAANAPERLNSLTVVLMPDDKGADLLRTGILNGFDMSVCTGLYKLVGSGVSQRPSGERNDLMLMGTLCGVEMGLMRAGVACQKGGAQAAMEYLAAHVG